MVTKKQNKSSKSRRAVPIIPPLLEAMEQVENKSGNVVNYKPDYVLNHVKRTCESAGITVVDLHGLRHSFASLAYHPGIPEMIAAEIGDWEDLGTMHNIYTHIAQSDIAKRSQDFQTISSLSRTPAPMPKVIANRIVKMICNLTINITQA